MDQAKKIKSKESYELIESLVLPKQDIRGGGGGGV